MITTASDAVGFPALDSLGDKLGFRLEGDSDLASVGAAMVSGEKVSLVTDRRWPLGPLPENVVRTDEWEAPLILISDRLVEMPRPAVVLRPPSLVAGVGCSRGVDARDNRPAPSLPGASCIDREEHRGPRQHRPEARRSGIDASRGEAGRPDPLPSGRSAFCCRGAQPVGAGARGGRDAERRGGRGGVLRRGVGTREAEIRERHGRYRAAARAGRLALVSLGPGEDTLIPPLAREALGSSEFIVGLDQYVDRIRHLLRPGTRVLTPPLGNEVERAQLALAEARLGGSVALVSSGDVGIYAMGSPALELADEDVEVVVVPGVTAAQAAASLLGSPLGHDHCSVSLSDLLTPWG